MDVSAYLAQYLVTNDEKVIGNIPNFLEIAINRVNKRLKSAFLEIQTDTLALSPDLVAIKWLTVNGELYSPSLTAQEATYSVQAGALSITPALQSTDVLAYVYYAVNQSILSQSSPAILIHGAAAEALIFEGNLEGAAAETALFNQDLDEALGWETNGRITLGGQGIPGNMVTPASTGGGGGSISLSNTTPLVESGSGAPGAANTASRGDHVHPASGPAMATTTPLVESGAGAVGTSAAAARADHVHPASGGGGGPALSDTTPLVESGAGAAGSAATASRGDHVHPASGPAMATTTPLVESGAGAVGTSGAAARADHVHPAGPAGPALSDAVPVMDGTGAAGVAATASRGDHVHPTDTAKANANGSNASGSWAISVTGSSGSCTGNAATSSVAVYSQKIPAETPPSGAYTIVPADAGKCKTVDGAVTVNSTMAAGDAVSIYNNSAVAVAITQGGGMSLRINGLNTAASRSLPAYTLATIWFQSAALAIVTGPGIT